MSLMLWGIVSSRQPDQRNWSSVHRTSIEDDVWRSQQCRRTSDRVYGCTPRLTAQSLPCTIGARPMWIRCMSIHNLNVILCSTGNQWSCCSPGGAWSRRPPRGVGLYHANGGGGLWHANRRTSGQLSFEGSWILLLNNNSRELVPITDSSDSKWVAQPSRRCPYYPKFVSMICSGPVVRSHQTNLIWINGHMPSDNLVEQNQ